MALKNIIIKTSINSEPSQSYGQKTYVPSTDEQSFPIETAEGTDGRVWPDFIPGTNYTLDLISNVTQSWSGSNTTPVGIIPYTHNTMEEFIDGEFSGSNYTVTNGSLIDEECKQFLIVSSIPVSYNIIPYSSIYENTINLDYTLNVFLNKATVPLPGEALIHLINDYRTGIWNIKINYLKVSRYDLEGNDNTLSLQELKQFRWTDSSKGTIILNVVNISEYQEYYLYEVIPNKTWQTVSYSGNGQLANYTTLDYYLNASGSYYTTMSVADSYIPIKFNYYNIGSGASTDSIYYGVNLSTNSHLHYSASITITNNDPEYSTRVTCSLIEYDGVNYNILNTTSSIVPGEGGIKIFTLDDYYSFISYPSGFYYLAVKSSLYGSLINITSASLLIEPSIYSPVTSSATSSTNIEPYLLNNFTNSDCDVLINNATQNDISKIYRKVLYSNDSVIPSNLNQIVSGTAEYAPINDYLYAASSNHLPRYKGVRTTSPNFNQTSINGLSNEQLSSIAFSSNLNTSDASGLPNVQSLQTYFAYFDYLQPTSCEIIGKSAAHILYLIDKDGTILTPTLTGSYYYNLIDNFETDKNSNVIIETSDDNRQFIGNKKIIRPGTIPRAIMYTQTGSGYNIQSDISFGASGSVVASNPINYVSKYSTVQPYQFLDFNSGMVLNLDYTTLASPYIRLDAGNNCIEVISGSNNVNISFALYATWDLSNPYTDPGYSSYNLDLWLEKSTDGGATWFSVAYTPFNSKTYTQGQSNQGKTGNWILPTQFTPVTGDRYRYRFSNPSSYYREYFRPQTYVQVSQTPPASTATASIGISNYWVTGSQSNGTPKNIIHSTQLMPLYIPSQPLYQIYNPSDGYAPCLPFVINSGDQIRFEGDELQTYTIGSASISDIYSTQEVFCNYTNTQWSTGSSNWTINNSTSATCTGGSPGTFWSNSLQYEADPDPFNDTQIYTLYFEVTNYTSGDISISLGGPSSSIGITGTGFYSGSATRSAYDQTAIYIISNNFIGTISNLTGIVSSLVLTLDRDITIGTDLNSFLIRRLNPHPNFIVLDTLPLSGSGYLFPQYATNELKQNFDNIIVNLKERGLI